MAVTTENDADATAIRPFTVEISDSAVEDLRARIGGTRLPEKEPVFIQELAHLSIKRIEDISARRIGTKREIAPLFAFYGMGLQGWDASYHFAANGPRIGDGWPHLGSYVSDTPHYIGQFPALAFAIYATATALSLPSGTVLSLTLGFVLSNAIRTLPAIGADMLIRDLHVTPQGLAALVGAFPLAFAIGLLPVGAALDRYGVRPVALVLVAIGPVLVQVTAVVIDVALVLIAIFAIGRQVALIFVDVALIGVAVRAVFRQILLVASNILLVIFDVQLLRTRILALGISATGEQTGKSNCEHTSTYHSFCVHFSSP